MSAGRLRPNDFILGVLKGVLDGVLRVVVLAGVNIDVRLPIPE